MKANRNYKTMHRRRNPVCLSLPDGNVCYVTERDYAGLLKNASIVMRCLENAQPADHLPEPHILVDDSARQHPLKKILSPNGLARKGKKAIVQPVVAIQSSEAILTIQQVAERLQLKPSTVYELTRRRNSGPLPVLRAGKFLRFRWSEIEAYLNE